jgi:hypothetical protein
MTGDADAKTGPSGSLSRREVCRNKKQQGCKNNEEPRTNYEKSLCSVHGAGTTVNQANSSEFGLIIAISYGSPIGPAFPAAPCVQEHPTPLVVMANVTSGSSGCRTKLASVLVRLFHVAASTSNT